MTDSELLRSAAESLATGWVKHTFSDSFGRGCALTHLGRACDRAHTLGPLGHDCHHVRVYRRLLQEERLLDVTIPYLNDLQDTVEEDMYMLFLILAEALDDADVRTAVREQLKTIASEPATVEEPCSA